MSKVKLSSGHFGIGTGASGIVDEVREARKITNRTAEILSKFMQVEVFHDDQSKNQNENINRIVAWHNCSDRSGDYSIHLNSSGATTAEEKGIEVLYYNDDNRKHAEDLASAISKAIGLKNRGAKKRTDLGFLLNTNRPAWLIEAYFVNSKADVKEMDENHELDAFCNAVAKTIAQHLGVKFEIKDREEEMEFSSKALKEWSEYTMISPARKEIIVNAAVNSKSADESWLVKHKKGEMTAFDYFALAAMHTVNTNK